MTNQEVEEIKGHVDRVALELRSDLRGEIADVRSHTDVVAEGLRRVITEVRTDAAATAQGLRQDITEVRHYTGVLAEELLSQIRAVAEGVALAAERINDVDLRVDSLTGEVRRGFAGVRAEIHRLHETDDELRRRIEAQEQRGA